MLRGVGSSSLSTFSLLRLLSNISGISIPHLENGVLGHGSMTFSPAVFDLSADANATSFLVHRCTRPPFYNLSVMRGAAVLRPSDCPRLVLVGGVGVGFLVVCFFFFFFFFCGGVCPNLFRKSRPGFRFFPFSLAQTPPPPLLRPILPEKGR